MEGVVLIMSVAVTTSSFPSTIHSKLRAVLYRHAFALAFRSLAIAACVFVVLLMASMLVDWWFPFNARWSRYALTYGSVACAFVALIGSGWKPFRRAMVWKHVANAVDQGVPALQERWSTVSSLAHRDPSRQTPLEKAMARQVTSEAIAMERVVVPSQIAAPESPQRSLIAAATATLVLSLLIVIAPAQLSLLLHRFWHPSSNITATQIRGLAGDQSIPRGQKTSLTGQLKGIPRSTATLVLLDETGEEERVVLRGDTSVPDHFEHSLRLEESMSYQWIAGDGRSPIYDLRVIDYPQAAEIEFTVNFPAYVDRLPVQRDRLPRRVKVPENSDLQIAIWPDMPLDSLNLSIKTKATSHETEDDSPREFDEKVHQLEPERDGWYRFEMPLVEDVLLEASMTSPDGLNSQRRLISKIDVIADKAPVARILGPTDETAAAFDEQLEIEFEAHDDHGITAAELVIYDESQKDENGRARILATRKIDLGDQKMSKHVNGKAILDLKELGVAPDSEVSYAIRVTDNRGETESKSRSKADKESDTSASERSAGDGDQKQSTDTAESETDAKWETKDKMKGAKDITENSKPSNGDSREGKPEAGDAESPTPSSETKGSASDKSSEPSSDSTEKDGSGRDDDPRRNMESIKNKAGEESLSAEKTEAGNERQETSDETMAGQLAEAASKESEDKMSRSAESTNTPQEERENEGAASSKNEKPSKVGTPESQSSTKSQSNSSTQSSSKPQSSSNTQSNSKSPSQSKSPSKSMPTVSKNSTSKNSGQPKASDPKPSPKTSATRPPTSKSTKSPTPSAPTVASVPRKQSLKMQQSRSGQNTTTRRRRVQVTERLSAIAAIEDRPGEDRQIRESVVEIDRLLKGIETGLRKLVDHTIADSDRGEQFRRLDSGLQNVETYVADLRSSTRENQYAFVGLQMVDIARTHVTPARDRVFQAIQKPGASDVDATASLQHIVRARELLAALLKRYDRVRQEKKLEKGMDQVVTMYEVYQEKRRMLMREARQNLNPMQRKMAIVEVDQEYLDRLAEVVKLRSEMMEELAKILGDDPRLLSRYMELVKRRGKSLRDRLTELSERQYEATEETLAWIEIDASQQQEYWSILAELRLTIATDLAKDAAELSERIEKQVPLELSVDTPLVANLIQVASRIAKTTRDISFAAEEIVLDPSSETDAASMVAEATRLVPMFDQLAATLDQLQFERSDLEVVQAYVEPRLLEAQVVRDLAESWRIIGRTLAAQDYPSLVQSEQHQLAIDTQLLRVEMLDMRTELDQQFQRVAESSLPEEIAAMIHELHHLMEAVTFNQIAAGIRAGNKQLDASSKQQQLAMERLEQAEALFDKIRRAVVDELDQYDVQDPNIANLRDPTLDEFLARLEREPNIVRQLGIPNRRTNLRIVRDSMLWQQNGSGMLGSSGQSAGARALQAMKMKRQQSGRKKKRNQSDGKNSRSKAESQEEQRQRDEAKKMQQMLAQSLVEIKKRRDAPETNESDRRQLEKLADEMEQAIRQADSKASSRVQWDQMVKSDEAKQLLASIAGGDSLADNQWNKLLSTLDDGLWQVKGKQPPEAYRKAIQQYQDQLRELTGAFDE